MTGVLYAVLALPLFTGLDARGAKPIGSFGLVAGGVTNHYHPAHTRPLVSLAWSTNAYQPPDLAQTLPPAAFTNLHLRDGGQDTDSHIVAGIVHQVAGWASVVAGWAVG